MRQKEFRQLLIKYRKGQCTPQEEALIEEWLSNLADGGYGALPHEEMEAIRRRSWTKLRAYPSHSTGEKRSSPDAGKPLGIIGSMGYAVAASLLLLVLAIVFLPQIDDAMRQDPNGVTERAVFNSNDHIQRILLEDGSSVDLAPGSRIVYQEPFDDSLRRIALEGEAFFEVTRDTLRPFLVITNEVLTRVLGTSFKVCALKDSPNITVEVKTGKVAVITGDGAASGVTTQRRETILTPNQKIVYDKNLQIVTRGLVKEPAPVLPAEEVARMNFERAPVASVFEGLEKVYNVDIEFDHIAFETCILTTSIAGGSIRSRLDIICQAINAQYTFEENKIVIRGEGCGKN